MNYLAWFAKNKTLLFIIIIALIIIGIFIAGKKAGKRKIPKETKLPTDGQGIPIQGYDPKGNPVPWSPGALADEAFEVLDGIWDSPEDKEALFNKLMAITDDQLVAVFNEFNRKHYTDDEGTLLKWIIEEWNVSWGSIRPVLIDRMKRLELRTTR